MSIVTDELKDDAKFLRAIGLDEGESLDEGEECVIHTMDAKGNDCVIDVGRLNRIAGDLENYASLMHSTSLLLEQRAEEQMDKYIRAMLDSKRWAKEDTHTLTLWLIVRALRNGASKALLEQGLASLGVGALGSMFGDVMKGKGKAPLDPEDKG